MSKARSFLNQLVTTLNKVESTSLKSSIGDSTNNNRTVTVNQTIRYLTNSEKSSLRKLGRNLNTVYNSRKTKSLIRALRSTTRRTDAVDINELLSAIRVATEVPSFNRSIGRSI